MEAVSLLGSFFPEMSTAEISRHTFLLAILKYVIFVNSDYSAVM